MQNLTVRQLDTFRSQVTLEPLKQGFGHTLGNALRRVLLSSIEGAAPTEVIIKSVKHEYSTIEGVQEAVIDIILNVKGIRFSIKGRHSVELTLKAKGPGVVTAKDIELPHDVEILNPDHVIATLTQAKNFEMTIRVQKGQGYVPVAQLAQEMEDELAENTKVGSAESNIIFLDASFSPVKKVAYTVENARVEQRTDFDRLVLEIETNGTVSPEEVVTQAARILQEQLAVFSGIAVAAMNKAQQGISTILAASIDDLDLTVRSANALKSENINTVRDLVIMTEDQLMLMANLGKKSLLEIKQALGNHGLHLGMDV